MNRHHDDRRSRHIPFQGPAPAMMEREKENKKNKSYQIEIMLHNKYKVDKYEISSAWEGDRFVTRIKS